MIDEDYKVYLIEININPCLGVTSSFSSRFITSLVDNTLRIAVDPLLPPPQDFAAKKYSGDALPEIRYELIFDQRTDGPQVERLYQPKDRGIVAAQHESVDELNEESDKEEAEEDYPDEETAD